MRSSLDESDLCIYLHKAVPAPLRRVEAEASFLRFGGGAEQATALAEAETDKTAPSFTCPHHLTCKQVAMCKLIVLEVRPHLCKQGTRCTEQQIEQRHQNK